MNTTSNIGLTFYQNLGKLFYAVAASDKVVRASEYDSLKKIIKTEWVHVDDLQDEFGADAAFQIEIIFDWLNDKELSAEEAFNDFKNYYNENKHRFSNTIKIMIWNTANTIAGAFSGKNKSELTMLANLKLMFDR